MAYSMYSPQHLVCAVTLPRYMMRTMFMSPHSDQPSQPPTVSGLPVASTTTLLAKTVSAAEFILMLPSHKGRCQGLRVALMTSCLPPGSRWAGPRDRCRSPGRR